MTSKRQLLRILERERQAFQTERAQLLDRIADLAGRPWTPSPASLPRPSVPRETDPEQAALLAQITEL